MTAAEALASPVRARASLTRVIVAASIGNALEWFDFLVYGYFAVTIAKVFFPAANETASLLAALGTFGVSYLVRPFGAIVIGTVTDRHGRKAGLTLSILLMVIGTTMTALMPGYATIGLAAPILILFARLLQGFSVGGEFGSAVTFSPAEGTGFEPSVPRDTTNLSMSPLVGSPPTEKSERKRTDT
jgi:MFS transporter, MHS family, proline/betaine transporter